MNFIAPRAKPLIREIPLSRLALAPENVRKTPPDAQADAALKASIAAFGLLENLVVRPDPGSGSLPRPPSRGDRLRIRMTMSVSPWSPADAASRPCRRWSRTTVFDADHPVPCQVRTGDAEPGEVSLAENVVRIAMHPADQVVAFAKLVEAGQSVSAIAARFGASERVVEQRLRLGNAAPELLDAYRADEIDLEVLKAFAVTTDRDRQMAVWEQVAGQGYRPSAGQVKRLLDRGAGAGPHGDRTMRRGGGIRGRRRHGPARPVRRRARARRLVRGPGAAGEARHGQAPGGRRRARDPLEVGRPHDRSRVGRHRPLRPHRTPARYVPTDEERAEIEKLETRYDELRGLDDDAWTEPLLEEAGRIEARLDEIEGAVEARAMSSGARTSPWPAASSPSAATAISRRSRAW